MTTRLPALACLAVALAAGAGAPAETRLILAQGAFVHNLGAGRPQTAPASGSAAFDAADGSGARVRLRIESRPPEPERPGTALDDLSFEAAPGDWRRLCGAEGQGLRLAFPVPGAWDADGRFIADPDRFLAICTGGGQGKCVLIGADPGAAGPDGQPLPAVYDACPRPAAVGHPRGPLRLASPAALEAVRPPPPGDPAFPPRR